MTVNESCLTPSQLDQLIAGQVKADWESDWIAHLDDCPTCRQQLEQRSANKATSLEGVLQQPADSTDDFPLLHQVMSDIKRRPPMPNREDRKSNPHHPPKATFKASNHIESEPSKSGPAVAWQLGVGLVVLTLIALSWSYSSRTEKKQVAEESPREHAMSRPRTHSSKILNGPFVVVRAAGESSSFATLDEALKQGNDEGRIEIHHDGPLEIAPIRIRSTQLTIAAGDGYSPRLHLSSGSQADAMFVYNAPPGTSGRLEFSQLELELPDSSQVQTLLAAQSGSLHLRDCRILVAAESTCLRCDSTTQLEITACEIHAVHQPILDVRSSETTTIKIQDSFLSGAAFAFVAQASGMHLEVIDCTILSPRILEIGSIEFAELHSKQLQVDATRSIFKSKVGLFIFGTDALEPSDFLRCVDWRGRSNVFSGCYVAVEPEPEVSGHPTPWGKKLADWRRLVVEENSGDVAQPFNARHSIADGDRELHTISDSELWELVHGNRYPRPRIAPTSVAQEYLDD